MDNTSWCIVDTETTGLRQPIFTVEIGAQLMRGWEPDGKPFRRLLNHGTKIPPEAARVHGYTKEILERDGDEPLAVYRDFASYSADQPVCAYNLRYDWDDVLVPEWQRLSIRPIGVRGFCVYELAKRLLDPVPAGNCKLQTLRQYYRLPERGAHTALGDVETVIDLMKSVLRPLCAAAGLTTFREIMAYSEEPWYPSRITFGKYKGRHIQEASTNPELMSWLRWLADSENPRTSAMGIWYLNRLENYTNEGVVSAPEGASLAIYVNPDVSRLKGLIDISRNRLAELEAEYTALRQAVSVTQARLFTALKVEYRHRDILRIRLDLRYKYLDALLREGEEEAQRYNQQREEEEEQINEDYERNAREAEGKSVLSDEDEQEIKQLWRKLVNLFHPDRFVMDPAKQSVYEKLTSEINLARDAGNIQRLRDIAKDPEGFIAQQGWGELSLHDLVRVDSLERLYEALQGRILELIELLEALRLSPEHELHNTLLKHPTLFDTIVGQYRIDLSSEIEKLENEVAKVEAELEMLEG